MQKRKIVRGEFVIAVKGEVFLRDEGARNAKLETGEIEVHVNEILILNDAKTLPFELEKAGSQNLASRRSASEISIYRSSSSDFAAKFDDARKGSAKDSRFYGFKRFSRDRNADLAEIYARRRTRFCCSFANSHRKILCTSAIAADFETDHDDLAVWTSIIKSPDVSAMKTFVPTVSRNLRSSISR